ncbi:MAG: carbohydrate-binding domain-containing protein [Oscillospiraceae bacterium]|nr:carbohydrate-binding domain-containing protein [Oscillospiraceae bacterium]
MSTNRHIDLICILVLILTVLLTVLFMNGEAYGIQIIVDEDAEANEGNAYFTANDRKGSWDTAGATQILLRGDRAAVSGGGAYAYDGNVVISSAGKYVVSGTLDDGSILVDTDNTAKVWIQLNGAELHSTRDACIRVEQADKVFLTLAEGTDNLLCSTALSEELQNTGVDAALFARDDLTVNGSGTLRIESPAGHGIAANDDLVITGGTIRVNAARDALHANDGLRIMAADLDLTAADDGVDLNGPESELYIESGKLNISAADDGISAGFNLTLAGGSISVEAEKDGISASGSVLMSGGDLTVSAADDGIHADASVAISGGKVEIPACYEGIEAVTIDISGGDITIYPEDDGLNANGGGFSFGGGMPGGGMPAMQAGGEPESSEAGEQSAFPAMPGGERPALPDGELPERPDGNPPAMPDGERPAMPDGEMGRPDFPAEGEFSLPDMDTPAFVGGEETTASETWIHISGGSVTVINETARDADGLDSNGDIIISGGTVRVSLVNSGSNSALDYGSESGGRMEITGGSVIACGSYAMAEGFDSSSTQCSILYGYKRGAAAGTLMRLEDSKGNALLEYEVPCSFSSVALSCPEMQLGETYTLVIGDFAEEITLTEVSAAFGDAQSENFGGFMNWGGMSFRP